MFDLPQTRDKKILRLSSPIPAVWGYPLLSVKNLVQKINFLLI